MLRHVGLEPSELVGTLSQHGVPRSQNVFAGRASDAEVAAVEEEEGYSWWWGWWRHGGGSCGNAFVRRTVGGLDFGCVRLHPPSLETWTVSHRKPETLEEVS